MRDRNRSGGMPVYLQVVLGIVLAAFVMFGLRVVAFTYFVDHLNRTVQTSFVNMAKSFGKSSGLHRYQAVSPADVQQAADDYPPEKHPSKWDYIANADHKCWYHKITREKICR